MIGRDRAPDQVPPGKRPARWWRDIAYGFFACCGSLALLEGLSPLYESFINSFAESGLFLGLIMLMVWGLATLLASAMALIGVVAFWREPPLLLLSVLALFYVPWFPCTS